MTETKGKKSRRRRDQSKGSKPREEKGGRNKEETRREIGPKMEGKEN